MISFFYWDTGALTGGYLADYGPKSDGFLYSPIIFVLSAIIMLTSLPLLKVIDDTLKKK